MIRLRGVKTHNLKDLDLELPLGRLICVTGLSGSGKSSLVFDTLCIEARRRYFKALRLSEEGLPLPPPPSLEGAEGLPPSVGLEQKIPSPHPRSTVGTITGILDFLRVLYAEVGEALCPRCEKRVRPKSLREITEFVFSLPLGSRLLVLAPLREKNPEAFRYLLEEGFFRFLVDGRLIDLTEEELPTKIGETYVLVDRLILKEGIWSRLEEDLRLAGELSGGVVVIEIPEGERFFWTTSWRCPYCGQELESLRPELFSFNHPRGACQGCQGLGEVEDKPCPECQGERLKPYARLVIVADKTLPQLATSPLKDLRLWLQGLTFTGPLGGLYSGLCLEMETRLSPLLELGLGHLSLYTPLGRLSTGELQRLRLASILGERLSGCLYVFDEPGLGLSPKEKERVLALLFQLKDQGNTVVIVEHDPLFIGAADQVLELGPGAGEAGGRLLFSGPPEGLSRHQELPTGAFLSGKKKIQRLRRRGGETLEVSGLSLKRGFLNVLCGPSGAGKTRLLEKLAANLPRALFVRPARVSPRESLVISYIGAFKALRELLAATKEARLLGLKPKHFSPFTKEGRCPECQGRGEKEVRVPLLPPTRVVCDQCQGSGLRREALRVRYRGYHYGELLSLTIKEGLSLFAAHSILRERLELLVSVGLGYLRLGQSLSSLSGGERQRLYLARHLSEGHEEWLLFDLPTLGLHFEDVARLLILFDQLLDQGKTMVIADNHPILVLLADRIFEVSEGKVVFCGAPDDWLTESLFARSFGRYRYFIDENQSALDVGSQSGMLWRE